MGSRGKGKEAVCHCPIPHPGQRRVNACLFISKESKMQSEGMARLRVLSSHHWVLKPRDLPAALQGRQVRILEVDGLPTEPDSLVHFHPSVGGLRALSTPSANTSSSLGCEAAAFSISRSICYLLHMSPSLNWAPGDAKPARSAGFRAGRWENMTPKKSFLLPGRKILRSMRDESGYMQ